MGIKRLSHAVYDTRYHLVWAPKYRKWILKEEVRDAVVELFKEILEARDCEIIEMEIAEDHVHIFTSIPPKYSVSNVMGFLKGKLSTRLFHRYEKLGKKYWGRHLWSRGYCVSTVGLNEEEIRKYVKWQERKDREIEQQQLDI